MDNANSKIPNIIYSDGSTTIGQLNVHQDFLDFKVDNEYCVHNPKRFAAYQRAGYSLYLIDNGMEDDFVRYVGLMIKKGSGKKIYWGMDDIPMNDSGSRQFETTLTPQSLSFINQLCNNQKTNGMTDSIIPRYNIIKEYNQNNCNRNMRNKKVVRLTESQLHNIIAESVSQILEAWDYEKINKARQLHPNLMNKVDPRTFSIRDTHGTNALGRPRKDEKEPLRYAAHRAWEKQFSQDGERMTDITGSNYGVSKNEFHSSIPGLNFADIRINHRYKPNIDKSIIDTYERDSDLNSHYKNTDIFDGYKGENPNGAKIARQMEKGDGKYTPNQGWQ